MNDNMLGDEYMSDRIYSIVFNWISLLASVAAGYYIGGNRGVREWFDIYSYVSFFLFINIIYQFVCGFIFVKIFQTVGGGIHADMRNGDSWKLLIRNFLLAGLVIYLVIIGYTLDDMFDYIYIPIICHMCVRGVFAVLMLFGKDECE